MNKYTDCTSINKEREGEEEEKSNWSVMFVFRYPGYFHFSDIFLP